MNFVISLPALALSLLLAALPGASNTASATGDSQVTSDPGRELLSTALIRVVPGDIRAVRLTAWQVMPVAPSMQTVIGRASLDAGGAVPIDIAFRATLDLDAKQVMQLSYRMIEPARRAAQIPAVVDTALRSQISAELVAQFPNQPMDFHITAITGRTRTAHHLVIEGEGLSDFFAEGRARTPFVATFAVPSAQLLRLDYDLVAVTETVDPIMASR